jgi:hypothetical protein
MRATGRFALIALAAVASAKPSPEPLKTLVTLAEVYWYDAERATIVRARLRRITMGERL